jgi:hypothetical protein
MRDERDCNEEGARRTSRAACHAPVCLLSGSDDFAKARASILKVVGVTPPTDPLAFQVTRASADVVTGPVTIQ